jgi:hypothetical protein
MSIYVTRSSSVAARSFDGEMIIMSTRDSNLFTLNETAAEIWKAADGRTPLEQIVRERICTAFEVEVGQACADAETLCRELSANGILTISDAPIETPAEPQQK